MNNIYKIGIIVDDSFCCKKVIYTTIENIYNEYKDRDDIILKFNIIVNGMTECVEYTIQQLSQYYPIENIVKVDNDWILNMLRRRHNNLIPRGYFANNDELIYKERDKLFLNGCSRIIVFISKFCRDKSKLNELSKKIDLENKRIRKHNDSIIKQQQLLLSKRIKRRTKSLKNEKYINVIYDM